MSDAQTKAIMEEIATVHNYLTAAQGVLDSGYMPDITALESRVAELCGRIQKAPEDIHPQCRSKLVELMEQLNRCEEKMRTFHESRVKLDNPS